MSTSSLTVNSNYKYYTNDTAGTVTFPANLTTLENITLTAAAVADLIGFDASKVTSIKNATISIAAGANFTGLTSWEGSSTSTAFVLPSATFVYDPAKLKTIKTCTITADAVTLNLTNCETLYAVNFATRNGGIINLPKVTSWTGSNVNTALPLPSASLVYDLSKIQNVSNATITADGVTLDLTDCKTLDNVNLVTRNGGIINLPNLETWKSYSTANFTNSALVFDWSKIKSLTNGTITADGVTLDMTNCGELTNVTISTKNYGVVNLPALKKLVDCTISGTVYYDVTTAYTATITASVKQGAVDTPVVLSGMAISKENGGPVAFADVNIHISVRGFERIYSVRTDNTGQFSLVFNALPGEGGHYTVFASHPDVPAVLVQETFDLFGIRAENIKSSLNLIEGQSASGGFDLRNLADIPVTGLNISLLNLPANLEVSHTFVSGTDSLGSLGTQTLLFEVKANDDSVISGKFVIRISSNEAPSIDIPVTFRVEALEPKLETNTGLVEAGMVRGKNSFASFTVTNNGRRSTGDINVMLPQADWLSLAVDSTIPSLAPGESATVTLRLSPTETLDYGTYSGNVFLIYGENQEQHLIVPFKFAAVSDAKGNLAVTVTDEYTYYTDEAPNITGAKVRITDAVTGAVVQNTVSGADGKVVLADLREGYYTIQVTADKHQTFNATIFLEAGKTKTVEAFLAGEYVTYTWNVVPTEIEDVTTVTLVTTYETNVPAPVIIAEPQTPTGTIDFSDLTEVGQQKTVMVKLTNHGMIAAQDITFHYGTHPVYSIEPLLTDLGTLAAKSSIYVPVVVKCIATPPVTEQSESALPNDAEPQLSAFAAAAQAEPQLAAFAEAALAASIPCELPIWFSGKYQCGSDGQLRQTQAAPVLVTIPWVCVSLGGGGGSPIGSGSIGGPGGIIMSPPKTVTATCKPKVDDKDCVKLEISVPEKIENALESGVEKLPIIEKAKIEVSGSAELCVDENWDIEAKLALKLGAEIEALLPLVGTTKRWTKEMGDHLIAVSLKVVGLAWDLGLKGSGSGIATYKSGRGWDWHAEADAEGSIGLQMQLEATVLITDMKTGKFYKIEDQITLGVDIFGKLSVSDGDVSNGPNEPLKVTADLGMRFNADFGITVGENKIYFKAQEELGISASIVEGQPSTIKCYDKMTAEVGIDIKHTGIPEIDATLDKINFNKTFTQEKPFSICDPQQSATTRAAPMLLAAQAEDDEGWTTEYAVDWDLTKFDLTDGLGIEIGSRSRLFFTIVVEVSKRYHTL
jgi:uncharacterized membrane protein